MNPVKIAHLSWVRAPIEKAIELSKQVMVNITTQRDRLSNPPPGAEPSWFVKQREMLEESHESLRNTLAGVEAALDVTLCTGGCALAKEAQTLSSLIEGMDSAAEQDKCLLAIQNAMNVLPSFIGMVIEGAHDAPGVLLKNINELRALRGVGALSDDSALPINLTFAYKSPPLYQPDCDLAERERVFATAAASFCLLYSQAMKGNGAKPWIDMRQHLRDLQRVTNDPTLGCYWWVGEAIVDVIIADGLHLPPAMNTALRVVMVATQRLPQGESAAMESLSPAKFSALLNSLSISRKQTDVSNAVVTHFDVKENVEEDRLAQLQQMLEAQSVQSIADVIPEIKPRLETAMVSFGRAVASKYDEGFRVQIQAFDQAVRTIANVFGIFNESDLSDLCFDLADMVKGVSTPADFSPEAIETIKTQILFLDSKLNHLDRNPAAEQLQIRNVTPDVVSVIADVTYAELKKVGHMIATHIDSGIGSDKLMTALNSLHEVANVYEFAGSITIGNILSAIVTVITDSVNNGVLAETENLRVAARAMSAIEMYLQYITTGLQPPASLIEVASDAVREMGIDVAAAEFVTKSALLAKFDTSLTEDDRLDPLLREIFELRPTIEAMHANCRPGDTEKLNQFAVTCMRLGAAALIKDEKHLHALCRFSAEIAKDIPGRIDDPQFDTKEAIALIARASEMILRSADDYASKGKVNLFLLDIIDALSTFVGVKPASPEPEKTTAEEASLEVRPMPEGYDPYLQTLFDEEFKEYAGIIHEFLSGENLAVTERVCRAIHSIHGCSGSAGCSVINSTFDVLEERFYALKAQDQSLTRQQASDLADMLGEIAEYQAEFPWVTDTALASVWIEIAGSMVGHKREQATIVTPEAPLPAVVPEAIDHISVDAEVLHANVSPADTGTTTSLARPESLEPEYDLEQYEMYLFDADEVIPELQQNVQVWLGNMRDKETAISIRRNMHTLKGAAAIINASGIRTLTHHMETLFDAVASGGISADQNCADLVNFVLNEIITLSEAVRAQTGYRTPTALIEFIAKSAEVYRVDGDELNAVIQASYGAIPEAVAEVAEGVEVETPAQGATVPKPDAVLIHESTAPALPVSHAAADEMPQHSAQHVDQDQPETSGTKRQGTRRGYRGLRNRAVGERQRNWEQKQAKKSNADQGLSVEPLIFNREPEYIEIETKQAEISSQVINLIHRANESERESGRSKKRAATSEKIKVELQLLDNSIQHANELKASSYRQNTLYREMMLSIVALREKMSLALMHHNKYTVQLRNFNNMTNSLGHHGKEDPSDEDQRLFLERFNHLSAGNNQAGVQLEQMLQDIQDVITQSHLMETAFKHQTDVVAGLQRDLLLSRLVQFTNERPSVNGALTSALQVSQKRANLEFLGGDTLIDRQTLEAIRDPLRHVINNSVAHGLEPQAERVKHGKNPVGQITVRASRRSKALVIEVTDDGRGIDPKVIRAKAIQSGLIKEDDILSDQEIIYLITESGFSTAQNVSELAGRGVGMDIVRNKLAELGGQLHIRSELGKGTTMELELPLTIGSNRALVCCVGDQWFAIPTFNMTQVLDYPAADLAARKAKSGNATVEFEGKSFEVVHLADLIAIPDLKIKSAQSLSHTTLVLVEQNNTRLAIEVERGISMPEIHVTKFDGILSSVKGIIGGTEIHDGTPALVLDVIELARLNLKLTEDGYKPKLFRIRRIRRDSKPLVLVVDDSNSYRRLLTTHFDSLGWEVAVARDGQDAVDKLPTLGKPSLFVVDMEMPRMNGLELTRHLRGLSQYDAVPIIMLTTRSNLKDTALEMGVNHFLSKPYDAAMLNEAVRLVCPQPELVGAA